MIKNLLLMLLVVITLAGCSLSAKVEEVDELLMAKEYEKAFDKIEEYKLASEEVKNPKYDYKQLAKVHKVNTHVENEEYDKAVRLIEENEFASQKLLYEKYNYQDVLTYAEMVRLFEDEKYRKVLSVYNESLIKDEYLLQLADDKIIASFKNLTNDYKNYVSLTMLYEKFDKETVERISSTFNVEEKLNEAKTKYDEYRISTYLEMIEKEEYDAISSKTELLKSNIDLNFHNLAKAYSYYEDFKTQDYQNYAHTLANDYLKKITHPIPEVEAEKKKLQAKLDEYGDYGYEGLSEGQVTALWGEPLKKIEDPYKSIQMWTYPDNMIVFLEVGFVKYVQK
ncbi:hypothetical protein ACFO3D_14525 [Virgibacillus kekensis]|uniref:Lipoprotein n=1 Tax=Virgibacillus kekensis TaxID=202261 RepID=A0ABV9DN54_9BACI